MFIFKFFITDVLVETDLFSDALNMQSNSRKNALDAKKRKRRLSTSKEEKTPASPTTPTNTSAPLKFYQDTLSEEGEKGEKLENNKDEKDDEKKSEEDGGGDENRRVKKLRHSSSKDSNENESETINDDTPAEKKPPGIGTGPDGPPGILKLYNAKPKKKSISWKVQEDLVEVRYFELDVTERVNVTRTFNDMRNAELLLEREKIIQARNLPKEDLMVEKISWGALIEIDGAPDHQYGSESQEKRTQADRERTVLQALYFNRAMIPDSPFEAEFEQHAVTDPKVIPMDDVTGNPDAVNEFTHIPWPEPKGDAPNSNSLANTSVNNFANFNNNFSNQGFPPHSAPQPTPWNNPHAVIPPPNVIPPQQFLNPMNPLGGYNVNPGFVPPGMMPFGGPPPSHAMGIPPPNRHNVPDLHWLRGNKDRNRRDWDRDGRRQWEDHGRNRGPPDSRQGNRNVCRQFVKFGNCRAGDKCQYYHPR